MEKFDKLVALLDELAEKYQFEDADIAKIQEILYDVENGEDMYDGSAEEIVEEDISEEPEE